jgi:hypothetical protein
VRGVASILEIASEHVDRDADHDAQLLPLRNVTVPDTEDHEEAESGTQENSPNKLTGSPAILRVIIRGQGVLSDGTKGRQGGE